MFGTVNRIFARNVSRTASVESKGSRLTNFKATARPSQRTITSLSSGVSRIQTRSVFLPALAAATIVGAAYSYQSASAEEKKENKSEDQEPKKALNPNEFVKFKVMEVEDYNYNSKLVRFELKDDEILGLNVASALVVKAPIGENGKPVIRPYTPVSSNDDKGHWDLLVKVYEKGVMSKYLGDLKPGDELEVKGPIPKLAIKPNMKKKIAMVAGGSGITPMYQVVNELLKAEANSKEKTELTLLFANVSEDDILLKETFDRFAAENDNFKVHYFIEKKGQDWKGEVGRVTPEVAKKLLPAPSDDHLVLVCGPPAMMNAVSGGKAKDFSQGELAGFLKELGYTKDQVYKF